MEASGRGTSSQGSHPKKKQHIRGAETTRLQGWHRAGPPHNLSLINRLKRDGPEPKHFCILFFLRCQSFHFQPLLPFMAENPSENRVRKRDGSWCPVHGHPVAPKFNLLWSHPQHSRGHRANLFTLLQEQTFFCPKHRGCGAGLEQGGAKPRRAAPCRALTAASHCFVPPPAFLSASKPVSFSLLICGTPPALPLRTIFRLVLQQQGESRQPTNQQCWHGEEAEPRRRASRPARARGAALGAFHPCSVPLPAFPLQLQGLQL